MPDRLCYDAGKQRFPATVLTDGPRLFIQENVDGRFVVAQVVSTPVAVPGEAQSRRKLVTLSAGLVIVAVLVYLVRPTLPSPSVTRYTQITHDGQQKSFAGQVTAWRIPPWLASDGDVGVETGQLRCLPIQRINFLRPYIAHEQR
jgi:hypothetical protein